MVKVKSSRKKDEPKIKRSLPPKNDDDNDDDSVDSKGNIRELIDYSDEESVLSSPRPMKRKPRRAALRAIESFKRIKNDESDDESDDERDDEYEPKNEIIKANNDANDGSDEEEDNVDEEEYDEDDDEDDEDDEEYDEDEDEEYNKNNIAKIIFGYGGLDEEDRFKPKRHKLEEEPEEVKKFVDLLSKSNEQSTIDDQIDYFKKLEKNVQSKVIEALERKPDNSQESMMFRILSMNVSPDIQTKLLSKYNTLQMMDSSSGEYFKNRAWLEKVVSVPFGIYKELPATLDDGAEKCHDFMKKAQNCLAEAIYGQEEAKLQILQFIATKLANPKGRGLSLLLSGSPGIGKCHAKDTPILMANGSIKLVQDIIESDEIMGDDSKPRKVLSLGRGKDNMYDIIPVKGTPYRVNSEHILCLKYSGNFSIIKINKNAYKVKEFITKTLNFKFKTFHTKSEAEKYIETLNVNDNIIEISVKDYLKLPSYITQKLKTYRSSVDFPHIEPDFDPYIIGLWLGDGASSKSVISNQDSAVLLYLRNTLPSHNLMLVYNNCYDYGIRAITSGKKDNILLMTLKKYNMINNKHIPNIYKINSREVRLQVLAGLIDSDGSYFSKTFQISTIYPQLRDDILYLSRSLGFAAYSREKTTTWTYKGEKKNNKCFSIHISGNINEIPVKIERKKATPREQIKDVLVSGITVKESGFDDYYGFTLDGNHRYLMGDFTVTHNTSLIKNGISKSLEWPFEFISLGGDSDATTYTGHQMVYEGSHCGKIVNSIITAKSMSMVMMFDELDKISTTPKGEEVQNLLIHLTDSVQNSDFEDKYISGIPIDLSKIMFVFSANDLSKIDKVLLDRMIVIELKGYNSKDKAEIAKNFLVPNALKEVNLIDKVTLSKEIIDYILSNYCKEEPGVREFKRAIEQVVQKINMLRIFNSKDMPFYIENFSLPFVIEKKHIDLFLKKRTTSEDTSYLKMYV